MKAIAKANGYTIWTDFGTSVREGSIAGREQGSGRSISFSVTQSPQELKSVYVEIVPLDGLYGDFWDNFWSNKVGGEPADDFALSSFLILEGGVFTVNLNSDSYDERVERFEFRVFESNMDAAWGYEPLATAKFSIIDDDIVGTNGADRLIGSGQSDYIRGRQGNDTLLGDNGSDILVGGGGNDVQKGEAGNDRLFGNVGSDKLYGNAGSDVLKGGADKDLLVGGGGNDRLAGGGAADVFVFNKFAGQDTIVDFSGNDIIRIQSGANRMADLDFTDTGAGLRIEFGTVDIFLKGLDRTDVDASNFDFV